MEQRSALERTCAAKPGRVVVTLQDWLVPVFLAVVAASTPLLLAATGELVVEKSGVLNLGIEGMMLVGAIVGLASATKYIPPGWSMVCAGLGGLAMSGLFAVLVLHLFANQVAAGLALTIFGAGLSALIGTSYIGISPPSLDVVPVPWLSDVPVLGLLLFGHNPMVYVSLLLLGLVAWFLTCTRPGLILRAVGESHDSARAIGHPVRRVRWLAILFGGFMAGLSGGYLSLVYTPLWVESMAAGRGWIALALVVFAAWRPGRLLVGAYLFGAISIVQMHGQGIGLPISPFFMSMLPYAVTIAALVFFSGSKLRSHLQAPGCLGKTYCPDV